MSVTYTRGATFATIPMRQVRDLLRGYVRGGSVAGTASSRKVGLHPATAAAVMDEALAQGLLADTDDPMFDAMSGPAGYLLDHWKRRLAGPRPTVRGIGLMMSSVSSPLSRKAAFVVLGTLLDNADALNSGDGMPYLVDRVWLYGSLAKGAAAANDIDVVIETSRTDSWTNDSGTRLGRKWVDMAVAMGGDSALEGLGSLSGRALSYLKRRWLFGARRHPRLAPNDIDNLKALACECRLVFDRSRGGRVDDPMLDRHPESPGRSAGIFERLAMPDIAAATALRPVDAEFVDDGVSHGVGPNGGLTHGRTRYGQDWFADVEVGRTERPADGVAHTGFTVRSREAATRFEIARAIVHDRDGRAYGYMIDLLGISEGSGRSIDLAAMSFMSSLAKADVERVAMRSLTTDGPRRCVVVIRDRGRDPGRGSVMDSVGRAMSLAEFPAALATGTLRLLHDRHSAAPFPVPQGLMPPGT